MTTLNLLSEISNVHIDTIWCVKYHPFYNLFASCGSDKTVSIWEYSPSSKIYEKKSSLTNTHSSIIRSLDWDYSGKYLSLASFDKNLSIWKITNECSPYKFECITKLQPEDSEIKSVSWSVSGEYLACCTRKGNVFIFEKDNEDFDTEDYFCKSTIEAHKSDVKMVKFSPKEDVLFSCSFSYEIKIWKLDDNQDDFIFVNNLKEHSGTVWYIEFNKEGNLFFTCSDDKKLICWKIDYNQERPYENIFKISEISNLHSRPIYCCCLTRDEKFIVTTANDGNISVVKINYKDKDRKNDNVELELVCVIKDAHDQYNANSITCCKNYKDIENKNIIISCGDDCSIKFWELIEDKKD